MAAPLRRETIAQRLIDYPRDTYLYIGSFMKSIALGAGTIVLLEIFAGGKTSWPRLLPWFGSLMATMVTHTTWSRGVVLTNSRGNVLDSVFPLLMGIIEFLLFGVLSPRFSTPFAWRWWLIIVGLHALCGVALTHNRLRIIRISQDFPDDLRELGSELLDWVRHDRMEASAGAVLAFIVGTVALRFFPNDSGYDLWYSLLAVPFIAMFFIVVLRAGRQLRRIDEVVLPEVRVTNSG
jgi:hypothetical protein